MPILNTKQYSMYRRKQARRQKVKRYTLIGFAAALVAAGLLVAGTQRHPKSSVAGNNNDEQNSTVQKESEQAESSKPKVLKILSGEEYKNFYNSFAYPNVQETATPPPITYNSTADSRIQNLAVQRGYMLRPVAIPPLGRADGQLLQARAVQPWLDMKAAAQAEGLTMRLVSGFRSPDDQRQIFMGALGGYGATAETVAAGQSDHAVNGVLQTISVPGYSRHHTGYTIDLSCQNGSLESFGNSVCFQWISKNNYENAKKYGWIPSYPAGAGLQGPNPEPWEYVWVGTDSLYVPAAGTIGG